MDMKIAGNVVVVTGASGGIGRAIAVAFAREGAQVAITYRSGLPGAERTAELVREAGGEPLIAPFALEDPATAVALVDAVRTKWGALHALINNAVAWPAAFAMVEETTLEAWRGPVRANVEGTFALIHAALPVMRTGAWGRIVTISTGLAVDGFPGSSAYMTGKAALHGLHRTLAKELGPSGILTNILMAGAVDTRERPPGLLDQMKRSAVTGRLTEADEVARTALFLGSPANGHITGEALRCDGFYISGPRREAPRRADT
jgi:NAD(P)-dependent dehydrogenase (short-subunit alcohol dehydrogenase family)